ncbi:uncharacterized protein LOC104896429 [Beta vulgaris subsp. vulgaris]|uniref:uncharacterized protein LOC104896429 n=1 Tax=Beta vulgaris subsp. vulgaris TaxID=3555 RepID=UPI002036A70E|nr:uncharacterized protein LOC104896429 [Beta vulgaris subsp. vulgaris]
MVFQNWCFTSNNASHKGGRIVFSWQPGKYMVDIRGSNSQWIHCYVSPQSGASGFDCVFVYAFNERNRREELWQGLKEMAGKINGPWLVGGDFNCVLHMDERIGVHVSSWDIEPIRSCLDECGLYDMKCSGNSFTWNNKQEGNDRVFAKLDRVLINDQWEEVYHNVGAAFLNEGEFDHSPAIVSGNESHGQYKKPFKYFTMWKQSPQFEELVKKCWQERVMGNRMYVVTQKFKSVKNELKRLNKSGFLEIQADVIKAAADLEDIQRRMHEDLSNI